MTRIRNTTLAARIVQEAMGLISKIEEYDEKESWIECTERLEQYFSTNEITDSGKKRVDLLSGSEDEQTHQEFG